MSTREPLTYSGIGREGGFSRLQMRGGLVADARSELLGPRCLERQAGPVARYGRERKLRADAARGKRSSEGLRRRQGEGLRRRQ
eukprot:240441-Pleurochrysis_carterae.AAC.3